MQTAVLDRTQAPQPIRSIQHPLPGRTGSLTERNKETRPITLAKEIINQYWSHRNDSNPVIKTQAQALIRTHVVMLRYWRELLQKS